MAVSYNNLWKQLSEKNLNKTYLRNNGVHPTTIAKMGKNEHVTLSVIEGICKLLNCDISDVVSYVPDNTDK